MTFQYSSMDEKQYQKSQMACVQLPSESNNSCPDTCAQFLEWPREFDMSSVICDCCLRIYDLMSG